MSPLLAPVLAQLVTLGLSDRTEARWIASEDDERLEASTSPAVTLGVAWPRFELTLGYAPYVTITPLDREPREVLVFHGVSAGAQYRHQWRRTTLTLAETLTYGQHDFRAELLSSRGGAPIPGAPIGGGVLPPGGGGMTGGGGEDLPEAPARASDMTVHHGASTTSLSLSRGLSRRSTLDASAAYLIGGGLDEASRDAYPIVQGPQANVTIGYRLNRHDAFSGAFATQYAFGSGESGRSWISSVTAGWEHAFGPRTRSSLSAGVAGTWTEQRDGTATLSIYPTASAGIGYTTRMGRSRITASGTAATAPVLDLSTATVDPRLSVGGAFAWERDRTTVSATVASAVSLADDEQSALNSVVAGVGVAYDLGLGFSADAGMRGAWQTFGGETVLPPSWALFVGISWVAAVPLN